MLNQIIGVLEGRLAEEELEGVLREVWQSLAAGMPSGTDNDLQSRVRKRPSIRYERHADMREAFLAPGCCLRFLQDALC